MKVYRHLLKFFFSSSLKGWCSTSYLDLENFRAIGKTNNKEFSDSEQPLSALMEKLLTLSLGFLELVGKASGLHGEASCVQSVPPPNRQPNWLIVGSADHLGCD